MTNRSKERLELHKHAVIAEVYPFVSDFIFEQFITDRNTTKKKRIASSVSISPQVSAVLNVKKTVKGLKKSSAAQKGGKVFNINGQSNTSKDPVFADVEFQVDPKLSPIPDSQEQLHMSSLSLIGMTGTILCLISLGPGINLSEQQDKAMNAKKLHS